MVFDIVGHYVAWAYDEVRARPLYLVPEARGFARGGRAGADALWPAVSQDSLTDSQHVSSLLPS